MKKEWVCTDSDSSQYRKDNSDGTYYFIEKVWLDTCIGDEGYPDKEYTVKSAWIDLSDYTDYEKECAISGYYESFDEMYEKYGMYIEDIIAECIFEKMTDGSATTYGIMTEEAADDFIQKYIETY